LKSLHGDEYLFADVGSNYGLIQGWRTAKDIDSATKVLDRLRKVVTVPCNFNCLHEFFD